MVKIAVDALNAGGNRFPLMRRAGAPSAAALL
jgi:hypothetical protein